MLVGLKTMQHAKFGRVEERPEPNNSPKSKHIWKKANFLCFIDLFRHNQVGAPTKGHIQQQRPLLHSPTKFQPDPQSLAGTGVVRRKCPKPEN
jgi:hypothetical protein